MLDSRFKGLLALHGCVIVLVLPLLFFVMAAIGVEESGEIGHTDRLSASSPRCEGGACDGRLRRGAARRGSGFIDPPETSPHISMEEGGTVPAPVPECS